MTQNFYILEILEIESIQIFKITQLLDDRAKMAWVWFPYA